jgi:hypothetical protein
VEQRTRFFNVCKFGECDYEIPLEKGGHDALMEYLGLPQTETKRLEEKDK